MILRKQEEVIRHKVDLQNEIRDRKLKVEGKFTDEDNSVEYLAISTEGNSFMYGAIQLFCEASGLRFYGVEIRQGKLRLMLF